MKKKLPKNYVTYYNLLIMQKFWQVLYQILSIIFLEEVFIELNGNTKMVYKLMKLNISIATIFFNTKILKMV